MTYNPDEQDELIGDAMAVGGPAFAEELHYSAMDAADAICPWDGTGEEPEEYRRTWISEARRMVAERRVGLTATPEGPATDPDGDARVRSDADPAVGPGH